MAEYLINDQRRQRGEILLRSKCPVLEVLRLPGVRPSSHSHDPVFIDTHALGHKIGQLALVARAVPSVLPKWPAKGTSTMVTMHGFFDLKDETSEPEFQRALDDFVSHLKECELISSHKVMRRSPN